jgi:hypothetical protein
VQAAEAPVRHQKDDVPVGFARNRSRATISRNESGFDSAAESETASLELFLGRRLYRSLG